MNRRLQTLLNISVALVLISPVTQVQAIIKCQDAEGNWHMGDTLPPECAQEGYQELNERGLVVEETGAAPTQEEIAEEKRQAEIRAEQERQQEERERNDRILLDTFSTVEDIELARDGKIAAIETTIGLAQKRNEKLQTELDHLVEKAAASERAGEQPPEELVTDIEALRRQINTNDEFISDKRKEQDVVREDYAKSIERFKELKAID